MNNYRTYTPTADDITICGLSGPNLQDNSISLFTARSSDVAANAKTLTAITEQFHDVQSEEVGCSLEFEPEGIDPQNSALPYPDL